jgi:hypothetical protein
MMQPRKGRKIKKFPANGCGGWDLSGDKTPPPAREKVFLGFLWHDINFSINGLIMR